MAIHKLAQDSSARSNTSLHKSLVAGTILSLSMVLAACAGTPPKAGNDSAKLVLKEEKTEYRRLLAEAQRLSFTLDFDQLRQAFVESSEYSPAGGVKLKGISEAYQSVENDEYEACLTHLDKVLEINYMSLEAHMIGRVCSAKAEVVDRQDRHGYMVDGLMESIEKSGDGKSPGSAFRTISASELWGFVRIKGLQVVDQSLIYDNEEVYDKLRVRDLASETEYSLYFNVSQQLVRNLADIAGEKP